MFTIDFNTKYSSQFCSDGIVESIINHLYPSGHQGNAFELGASPTENNTNFLRDKYNWRVTQIDGAYDRPDIRLFKHFITKDNVIDIMKKYDVPQNLHLFSIDIDGNDFYILRKVLQNWQPDIIIAEYNANWHQQDKVMPYAENHVWSGNDYYGAGLLPLKLLMQRYGYYFVTCDVEGLNGYWCRFKIEASNAIHYSHSFVANWPASNKPTVTFEEAIASD